MRQNNSNGLVCIALVALLATVAIVAIALNRPISMEGDPAGRFKLNTSVTPSYSLTRKP